jgi:hypothetical protein
MRQLSNANTCGRLSSRVVLVHPLLLHKLCSIRFYSLREPRSPLVNVLHRAAANASWQGSPCLSDLGCCIRLDSDLGIAGQSAPQAPLPPVNLLVGHKPRERHHRHHLRGDFSNLYSTVDGLGHPLPHVFLGENEGHPPPAAARARLRREGTRPYHNAQQRLSEEWVGTTIGT